MRYIKFTALIMLLFSAIACKKFLDKKSSTGITVPSTISDLQALSDNSTNMNLQRTPSFSEASTDNYFILPATFSNRTERMQAAYQWIPYDNYSFPNDWAAPYVPVYNANYCLENIDNIPLSPENQVEWNNVKGTALFFRSYNFLQLVWVFSKAYSEASADVDLGIALRTTSDFNVPSSRASVKETYQKIISDAMQSLAYLPERSSHPFRPSKAASYGLLARVYLSMSQFDSAGKYAGLCLGLKNDLINYNGDPDLIRSITGTASPFAFFNKETIFYSESTANASQLVSPAFALIDTVLYNSYALNDLRRKAFFTPMSGYQRFKGFYSIRTLLFTGISTAEMYLTRAECRAHEGNIQGAMDDLNTVMVKRCEPGFVPYSASNQEAAINLILSERRKELVMRGLRFIDIKRLNAAGSNIVLKRIIDGREIRLEPNDNRYALPLPIEIVNISGMPQNPY